MRLYDYKGAVHLHSTYSDGHGSIEEIMQCANEVGLDFVVLTDHDQLTPAQDGHEKWHDSTLLIVGTEITPRNNHYIVFGNGKLKQVDTLAQKSPQEYIDAVNEQKWIGFIAHPDHEGTKRFEVESYKWLDWSVDRFTGMSLWDLMSDWQEKLDGDNLTLDVYSDFANWLTGPKEITLQRWDELSQKGKVVGVGEIDNHKKEREWEGQKFTVFPYDVAFRTITNHILLNKPLDKNPTKAKAQIVEAFKYGRTYIAFDYWDDPTEFSFEIEEGDQCVTLGDELRLKEKAEVVISLPQKANINLVRNGKTFWEGEGDEAIVETTEAGVYRVEAVRNDLTWILSNPIFVVKD